MTQNNLDSAIEFAENPEPRCPCVLLLDTSRSMEGAPIQALSAGVRVFRDELVKDALAARRVEVAVVSFDSEVTTVRPFTTVDEFEPPALTAQGMTCMGSGIHRALDMINERKMQYRANGMVYFRHWVLMITDGEPQGEADLIVQEATKRIRDEEARRSVAFYAVGVQNAAMQRLSEIVTRAPMKLSGLNFAEMFQWLSTSMQRVSRSQLDEQVPLPLPGTK